MSFSCLIRGEDFVGEDFNLIGRDKELEEIYSVLMRKNNQNVMLFGSAGVGCSSVLKGLQSSKSKGLNKETPFDIVSKRFFWLDVDALFSSSDTQEISANFKNLDNILSRSKDNILIIDNAGGFIDGAKSSGCENMINTIMGSIQDGKYQAILETHDHDLPKVLGIHRSIKEFFTFIELKEPDSSVLPLIVSEAAKGIQAHHNINISQEAIDEAISLTTKYKVSNNLNLSKAQPAPSISILDLAMSDYRISCHKNIPQSDKDFLDDIFSKRNKAETLIMSIEDDIADILTELEKDGVDISKTRNREVDEYRETIENLESKISQINKTYQERSKVINKDFSLSAEDVLLKFSLISNIPKDKLNEDEQKKLLLLEENMKKDVFNQDHVVEAVCNSILTSSVNLGDARKPRGAFMFKGSSGVGKTHVPKRLAYNLFGTETAMLRFDMSEYMEKHSVSRLIGAPPGYDGYENGGILTNQVRKNPHSIVLFDEIEKAHVSIFDVLLQVLDDGRLTDNRGVTVDFSNTFIIMTTNVGQDKFLDKSIDFETASTLSMQDLEDKFRPEFLNRIGGRENIIAFKVLSIDTILKIANVEIDKANESLKERGISLVMDSSEMKSLCESRYHPKTGARSIDGVFGSKIYPSIAKKILNGFSGSEILIKYDKSKNEIKVV
jgi:ATP-dependent Clp protease ATP-binding subunit ClpB